MRLTPPLHGSGRRLAAVVILILAGAPLCGAQTKGGNIQGYVFDPTAGRRSWRYRDDHGPATRCGAQNRYLPAGQVCPQLPYAGPLHAAFRGAGFLPYVAENFEVRVGETAAFSPELTLGTATKSIVVSAVATRPAIDTHQTAQADHIDTVRIENLPINRRDYLDLALLTPGVVNTNHLVDDRDSRAGLRRRPNPGWASAAAPGGATSSCWTA